jgi:hypothetical protein
MAAIQETSIEELNRQSARLDAETRKLMAETDKLKAEQYKLAAEQMELGRDTSLSPWLLLAQGLIAGAALIGAGAALAKFLIS